MGTKITQPNKVIGNIFEEISNQTTFFLETQLSIESLLVQEKKLSVFVLQQMQNEPRLWLKSSGPKHGLALDKDLQASSLDHQKCSMPCDRWAPSKLKLFSNLKLVSGSAQMQTRSASCSNSNYLSIESCFSRNTQKLLFNQLKIFFSKKRRY